MTIHSDICHPIKQPFQALVVIHAVLCINGVVPKITFPSNVIFLSKLPKNTWVPENVLKTSLV